MDTRRDIEEIFHAALEHAPGAEREAYVEGAVAAQPHLRERLQALLSAHEEASTFLEDPAVPGPVQEGPGTTIGPYKLLQVIGEGGMGIVYMAEQERPVRRKVALKVIKLGMDTRQVIARFEAERQALALMDHDNIARVLDAGATETGRPYFVMELVRGVPIGEYCDSNQLPTAERLELFTRACRGIQHAHNKGIIHRDIKPGNVLVTLHDGRPVPKIIDFGVAKATSQRLTEKTLFTEFRQFIGTPEYMSPEQAEMSGLDIDTRSDVYALGVLLYELLTGTTPVDPEVLRAVGYGEMTRMIREEEPIAPSTKVSRLGDREAGLAKRHGAMPGALAKLFRGDLDWIVMKALEKDRTRRYETVAALADDVRRHLENRPTEAGPVGSIYRLRKYLKRNRRGVAIASMALLSLVLGLMGSTLGFLRARDEAARSRAIADSLQNVLAASDPARVASFEFDAAELLATTREVFGEGHASVAATSGALALQLFTTGDLESAETLYREALGIWRDLYGEDHPNVAITMTRLGELRIHAGDPEEAEELLRGALAILDTLPGEVELTGCGPRETLAEVLAARGEYEEACALVRASLAARKAHPAQHRKVLETLEQLVKLEIDRRNTDGAISALQEYYDETQARFGPGSPELVDCAFALGSFMGQTGRREEAEPYLREALALLREVGETDGTRYLVTVDSLFQILRGRTSEEESTEADELLLEAIGLAESIWSPIHLAETLGHLAERYALRGRLVACAETLAAAMDPLEGVPDADGLRGRLAHGLKTICLALAAENQVGAEEYDRALVALDTIHQDEPEDPDELTARAALEFRAGRAEDALATIERMERPLAESDSPVFRDLGPVDHAFRALILARAGRLEEARSEREKLQEQAPHSTNTSSSRFQGLLQEVLDATPTESSDGK